MKTQTPITLVPGANKVAINTEIPARPWPTKDGMLFAFTLAQRDFDKVFLVTRKQMKEIEKIIDFIAIYKGILPSQIYEIALHVTATPTGLVIRQWKASDRV